MILEVERSIEREFVFKWILLAHYPLSFKLKLFFNITNHNCRKTRLVSDETSWSVKNENKRIEDNVCGRNVKQPKKNSEVKWSGEEENKINKNQQL